MINSNIEFTRHLEKAKGFPMLHRKDIEGVMPAVLHNSIYFDRTNEIFRCYKKQSGWQVCEDFSEAWQPNRLVPFKYH